MNVTSFNDSCMQNSRKDSDKYKLWAFVQGVSILYEFRLSMMPKCTKMPQLQRLLSVNELHSVSL